MRALLFTAAFLALASPAVSQSSSSTATLIDASTAPNSRIIIDGATWRCEGAACTASGGANQPALRACRRVVARLGAISAFSHKGTALNAEAVAACNA